MPTNHKLAAFRRWAREAPYNSVFVYHREPLARDPEVMELASKYSDAGLAFLYSRKLDDGRFEKCAKRTNPVHHHVLDKVSRGVQVDPSRSALGIRGRRPVLDDQEAA